MSAGESNAQAKAVEAPHLFRWQLLQQQQPQPQPLDREPRTPSEQPAAGDDQVQTHAS